jgi:endonuclease/exonuclease/phosphatase family metal-dependent hydrolase
MLKVRLGSKKRVFAILICHSKYWRVKFTEMEIFLLCIGELTMKRWMLFLFGMWAVLLAGCENQGGTARRTVTFQSDADSVKVMSFNVRYGTANDGENHWDKRKDIVFDTIAGQGADVVGVQEALDFQMDQIGGALRGYASVGVGRDDGLRAGEWCGIFYRKDRFTAADSETFWFSNSPWTPGSKHWGNQITRICTWVRLVEKKTGRAFYVFNLHMDHQSQPSRVKSAELLARRVTARDPKDPVGVTGDFNMGLDNPAMLYLRRLGYPNAPVELLDTWRLLNPDTKEPATFHDFKGGIEGVKIDHILVEQGTEVLDAQIDMSHKEGRYPSDHYPVTATLKLWNKQ